MQPGSRRPSTLLPLGQGSRNVKEAERWRGADLVPTLTLLRALSLNLGTTCSHGTGLLHVFTCTQCSVTLQRGAPGTEGKAEGNAIGGRSSSGIKGLTCRSFTGSPPPEGKQQLAPVPSNISGVGGWESSPQAAPPHHSLLPLFSFPPLFPFRLCQPEELLPHPTRPDRPSPAPVKPSAQHRGTSVASRPLRQPHGSATLRERVSCPPSLPASK